MTTPTSEILSVPAFSALRFGNRTYGYQLKKEGRLVMAPDGKNVLVAESIALHDATRDPSWQGVADRHAAARAEKKLILEGGLNENIAPTSVEKTVKKVKTAAKPVPGADDGVEPKSYNLQKSKAEKAHFDALDAKADYQERMKELMPVGDVRSKLAEIMTVLRVSIEGLPYIAAPILAATNDEAKIKAFLHAEVEFALNNASAALAKLGQGEF